MQVKKITIMNIDENYRGKKKWQKKMKSEDAGTLQRWYDDYTSWWGTGQIARESEK